MMEEVPRLPPSQRAIPLPGAGCSNRGRRGARAARLAEQARAAVVAPLLLVACATDDPEQNTGELVEAGTGGASGGGANGAGGAAGGVAAGGSGGRQVTDINRTNAPGCFADADALAERVASLKACETKDDCRGFILPMLVCMRPDLADPDSSCRGPDVALNREAPLDELLETDRALSLCLVPDGGYFHAPQFHSVDGRGCHPGCAAEQRLACIAGQCEIVPEGFVEPSDAGAD